MPEEPQVVLVEIAHLGDAVSEHGRPVDAQAEGPAGVLLRVDVDVLEDLGVDHARAQDLLPARAAADAAAGVLARTDEALDVDLGRGLGERKEARPEADLDLLAEKGPQEELERALAGLVKDGTLKATDIDEAVRRILTIKVRLGLFENPYTDETLLAKVVADPVNREEARRAAQRSMVLLRNEGSLLPLKAKELKNVAVIGPLADSMQATEGSWMVFGHQPAAALEAVQAGVGAGTTLNAREAVQDREAGPVGLDCEDRAVVRGAATHRRAIEIAGAVEDDDPFILHPGEFVLGQTLEWVELPDDLVEDASERSSAPVSAEAACPGAVKCQASAMVRSSA